VAVDRRAADYAFVRLLLHQLANVGEVARIVGKVIVIPTPPAIWCLLMCPLVVVLNSGLTPLTREVSPGDTIGNRNAIVGCGGVRDSG
jgi:hypothetical protein